MDTEEIPLPHDIKPLIRVWDFVPVLKLLVIVAIASLALWFVYRWWKAQKARKAIPARLFTDWPAVMKCLIESGSSNWQMPQCEKFYWALRSYLMNNGKDLEDLAPMWRRSEEVVFGGRYIDFQTTQSDWQSFHERLASKAVSETSAEKLLYPSELAKERLASPRKESASEVAADL